MQPVLGHKLATNFQAMDQLCTIPKTKKTKLYELSITTIITINSEFNTIQICMSMRQKESSYSLRNGADQILPNFQRYGTWEWSL